MRTQRLHLEHLEDRCVPTGLFRWNGSFFNQNWSVASNWFDPSGNTATRTPGSQPGDSVLMNNPSAYNNCILDTALANPLAGLHVTDNHNLIMAGADLHINGDSALDGGGKIWATVASPTLWLEGGTFTWTSGNLGYDSLTDTTQVQGTINVDGGTLQCFNTVESSLGFGINVGTGTHTGKINLGNSARIDAQAFGSQSSNAA